MLSRRRPVGLIRRGELRKEDEDDVDGGGVVDADGAFPLDLGAREGEDVVATGGALVGVALGLVASEGEPVGVAVARETATGVLVTRGGVAGVVGGVVPDSRLNSFLKKTEPFFRAFNLSPPSLIRGAEADGPLPRCDDGLNGGLFTSPWEVHSFAESINPW